MKRVFSLLLATSILATACRKIEVDGTAPANENNNNNNGENLVLSGRIDTDRTLRAGNIYKLRGIVYVVNGAKLTIEPGVTIQGEKASRGTLVVTRGTQLLADGTVDKPIVFTSDASSPASGDWGGIVILGRAKTNAAFNGVAGVGEIEGGVNNAEGLGLYGGADDNDNSGILKFVRVEYAGYAFLPDKELNGITFGAVGKGTVVDHVQVSHAADDSFEFFGGAVDCKHLIAYKGLDDDFDTDNGYSGRVQFAIGFRDSLVADISGSNGFESDNDAGGSTTNPQTSAIFSNVTLVGPRASLSNQGNSNYKRGLHIRRNSAISVCNSIVMGWPTGWYLDASTGAATDLNLASSSPKAVFSNNILAGNNTQINYVANATTPTGWTTALATDYFNQPALGNGLLATVDELGLNDPFKYDNTVDFNPSVTSPALTGSGFTNSRLDAWFTSVPYRGACGAGDTWWKGWTKF